MKNLLFTSTLFLIVNFSFAQTKIENDLTRDGLKGKVSFYSESKYDLVEKFGEIEKGRRGDKSTYKYDVMGIKIEGKHYIADGSADGSFGRKETYKYDLKGNNIEMNIYNADGSLSSKITFKYDEKGNMIEQNLGMAEAKYGSLNWKITYKYDEKGNMIEYNNYFADGSLNYKNTYTYKYDVKGNKIEYNNYIEYNIDRPDVSLSYESKYDEKGNKIESISYKADGSLSSKSTYKYDEKGNMIEENSCNANGSLMSKTTYKYEFDTMGNWIKKTCITDDSSINDPSDVVIFVVTDGSYGSYLIERVIEYY